MTSRAYFGKKVVDSPVETSYVGYTLEKPVIGIISRSTTQTTPDHMGPAIGSTLTKVPSGTSVGYGELAGEIHSSPADPDGNATPSPIFI